MYPQKWNKYAYGQNNPLLRIDPDGDDDFVVFRPLATQNGAGWNAIQAEAPKYGNTVTIYNGADATAARYTTALGAEDTHVVFAGHTVELAEQPAGTLEASSVLMTGNVGVGIAKPDGGQVVGVPEVNATDVAVFGCNSTFLSTQYGGTTFVGDKPGTNTVAEDAGAAAYTDTMVRGGTVDQAASKAEGAMVNTTNKANASPANKDHPYAKPQVCVTENGKTTCKGS